MSSKYQGGGLVDVYDIRNELYSVRNMVTEWSNNHLSEVSKSEGFGHDKDACVICRRHAATIMGVDLTIRRFGGRPR